MDEERIAEHYFARFGIAVNSGHLLARHDVGPHFAKSAWIGNGAELRTAVGLHKRLYLVATYKLEIASIGREQGHEKVTIVAQELSMLPAQEMGVSPACSSTADS